MNALDEIEKKISEPLPKKKSAAELARDRIRAQALGALGHTSWARILWAEEDPQ